MKQTKLVPVSVLAIFTFLCLSSLVFISARAEDQVTYIDSYCSDNGHYDQGSEYQNNLYLLLGNLTSESSRSKFYNFTVGKAPFEVYGLFLCNSIYISQVCQACITIAQGEIQRRCNSSVEAIIWYTECMIRYANRSIFSMNDVSRFSNGQAGPAKYSEYNQQVTGTFISLFHQATATSGNSSLMSATTVIYVTRDLSLSCYVDCTPDLSPSDCNKCLQTALNRLEIDGTQSGVLLQPSCRLMYSFNDARSLAPGKGVYVALGIVSAVAAGLLSQVFVFYHKARKTRGKPTGLEEVESMESLRFEFHAIRAATDNFNTANKLGQDGFGVVYKGTLPDGQAVAVKRLSNASGQGIREFKTEACLAAKLQHKNLVKLFGYCLEGNEMLLVYEFVPNKSLDRYLFDHKRGAQLKWETRYKIIVGIARGLSYLHEDSHPKIIHRDLKPSNILLDGEMKPKIADFGMAKLFGVDQTQGNTSRVAGTFGYMAPEYIATGHFSVKSDIFSYGVILLEIISGLRNSFSDPDDHDVNLLNNAWTIWNKGTYSKLVDPALGSEFSKDEVERCIHVGLLCVQEDPTKRPNIASVLLMLYTEPVTLPRPLSPPAFPYKQENTVVAYGDSGFQAEDVVSILSPR